jgi:4-aminobutyrate aminotransferase-like enzyme
MDAPAPGGLGGTYAGNPLSLAAALAVIDVIEEEKLCERALAIGEKLTSRLESLRGAVPQIADVRGLGAMVAVEFMQDGKPDADFTKRVQAKALEGGLVLLTCGTYGNVIRFLMPLTIEDSVLEEGLTILESAMKSA